MLDTDFSASPSSLRTVADFLQTLSSETNFWGNEVHRIADRVDGLWSGDAGQAVVFTLRDGEKAAETVGDQALGLADSVRKLADSLDEVLEALSEARRVARAADLDVSGYLIRPPARDSLESALDPLATPAEKRRAQDQKEAWEKASNLEYRARRTWKNAVERFERDGTRDEIVGLLKVSGFYLDARMSAVWGRVEHYRQSLKSAGVFSDALARHLDNFVVDGKVVTSKAHFYDLLNERDTLRVRAAGLHEAVDASKQIGSRISKASLVLGAGGFGYGTFSDIQDGESPSQALVSNGIDWAVAGGSAAAGAAIGTLVAPPVGTVVGGVIGGLVGIFAGGFANGVTDHVMEDLSPDLGGALSQGWSEVENIWNSITDGAKGICNEIF